MGDASVQRCCGAAVRCSIDSPSPSAACPGRRVRRPGRVTLVVWGCDKGKIDNQPRSLHAMCLLALFILRLDSNPVMYLPGPVPELLSSVWGLTGLRYTPAPCECWRSFNLTIKSPLDFLSRCLRSVLPLLAHGGHPGGGCEKH